MHDTREDGWQRVSDALPPPSTDPDRDYGCWIESDPVLAVENGRAVVAAYQWWQDADDREWNGWFQCGCDRYGCRPSHWRPLPAMPADVEKEEEER